MKDSQNGTLVVAAAPIGQPGDASPRLAAALAGAQVIAAEDTRRVRRLAAALGVQLTGRLVSYYGAVERSREAGLLAALRGGEDVLLVTDAGMPGVSDPGYRLVAAAAAAGLPVSVLPGPSAVTAALAVSGLPSDRFCFEGFPPRPAGQRARRFAELAAEPRTLVFFESPRRLAATLADLAAAFGPARPAVVCRELTKTHEEIRRGTLAGLAEWAAGGVLGEVTLVVAGAARASRRAAARSGLTSGEPGPGEPAGHGAVWADERQAGGAGARRGDGALSAPEAGEGLQQAPEAGEGQKRAAARAVAQREAAGLARKAAIAEVARAFQLRKREVYDAVVRYPADRGTP